MQSCARLSDGKIGGPDGLIAEVMKAMPIAWKVAVLNHFLRIIACEMNFPEIWDLSIAAMIPKLPRPGAIDDFRAVLLDPISRKLLDLFLMELAGKRLIPNPLPCYIFCGVKGMQASDLLILVTKLGELARMWIDIPAICIARIDLVKAFDNISWAPIMSLIHAAPIGSQ
eukprot:7555151-Karenia_brevis.AAC.1